MYGKTAAWQDQRQTTGYLLHWRPAVLSKQRHSILNPFCLMEHVLAMLKELKELMQMGKCPILDKG